MQQTDKTAGTKRVLSAVTLAILWLAGTWGGWAAEPPSGPTFTNSLGMGLVWSKPGTFMMGAPTDLRFGGPITGTSTATFMMGAGTDLRIVDHYASQAVKNGPDFDEQPAHPVTLTAPFYVGTVRVSQAQFQKAGLGSAPADGRVSWDRAAAFCAWLSQKEGLTYRLPTEAEWEYVRRNPGSVKDFEGEWVSDWHGAYRNVSLRNPAGPATGILKVLRADATNRLSQAPSVEGQGMFRVVLDTAPTNRFVASPLPFNQAAVKQSTVPALQGPNPAKPYFTVRFALPLPPGNDRQRCGSLLGVDPAVVDHNHSPGFEIMPNGDVLAVWFSGPEGKEYGRLVKIVQARLRYGAEEFDMPELLFKVKGDQDTAPCLWRDGSTNWLFTGWGNSGRFRVSRSTDSGATWTMVAPTPQFSSTFGTAWSEKMGWFFPVQGQLRLVALGDSRSVAGIDAKLFLKEENRRHPVAFNLAIDSAGLDTVELQIREYALRLPKIEWIVWGISPRIFNSRWGDGMKDRLINSPGYKYDRANPELVWRKGSDKAVMLEHPPSAAGKTDAWGFKEMIFSGDWRGAFKAPGTRAKLQALLQKPKFAYAQDRMQRFAALLQDLESRNIRVLAFTPPYHKFVKGQPCTDDDGTSREGYDQIVAALRELARSRRNFLFLDIDRKGENDFQDADFANFDHLGAQGAAKLTKMLDRVIAGAGKAASQKAGSPPKKP